MKDRGPRIEWSALVGKRLISGESYGGGRAGETSIFRVGEGGPGGTSRINEDGNPYGPTTARVNPTERKQKGVTKLQVVMDWAGESSQRLGFVLLKQKKSRRGWGGALVPPGSAGKGRGAAYTITGKGCLV